MQAHREQKDKPLNAVVVWSSPLSNILNSRRTEAFISVVPNP